jgi:dTDP-D-glucose 4,6-dehydratase
MVRNALIGENLPVYGDGMQKRDWLYVEDNVDAILRVLERGNVSSIYNVATGEERTNQEVVHAICCALAEEAGLQLNRLIACISTVPDRPGHDRRYALSTQKIYRDIGWSHTVQFETGLRKAVLWYLDNRDWVKRVTSGEYRTYYEAVYVRAWGESTL